MPTRSQPLSERRQLSFTPPDNNANTMPSQHYKDLIAKFTSSAPKPYGAIPLPKRLRRVPSPQTSSSPSVPLSTMPHDDMNELTEEDMFGAFPPTPPSTPPPESKSKPKVLKRQSMPASLALKPSPSITTASITTTPKSSYSSFPRPLTPSHSSPNPLLRRSISSPSTTSSSPHFSLYKFSISPPSTTYATLRSLNPFSASPPAPPPPLVEKSPLSLPTITSPTDSLGRFFTFLDDVAPVVAAAGGEFTGISEMPKWAGMGGTTSATVSTLSALLRNNDRLRAEMQFESPRPSLPARPPVRSCSAPLPIKQKSAPMPSAAAAGAPPAPLVIPGAQHLHLREPRLNPAHLRMMAAEMNMMRAGKLAGPLRPRGWLPRRRDPWDGENFVRQSELRQEISVEC